MRILQGLLCRQRSTVPGAAELPRSVYRQPLSRSDEGYTVAEATDIKGEESFTLHYHLNSLNCFNLSKLVSYSISVYLSTNILRTTMSFSDELPSLLSNVQAAGEALLGSQFDSEGVVDQRRKLRDAAQRILAAVEPAQERAWRFSLAPAANASASAAWQKGILGPWPKETMTSKDLAEKYQVDQKLVGKLISCHISNITFSSSFRTLTDMSFSPPHEADGTLWGIR